MKPSRFPPNKHRHLTYGTAKVFIPEGWYDINLLIKDLQDVLTDQAAYLPASIRLCSHSSVQNTGEQE